MRDAICNFIGRATPFKVCCEAGDSVAAIEKARERAPALVIVDLSIPMLNGIETASTRPHEYLYFEDTLEISNAQFYRLMNRASVLPGVGDLAFR